MMAVPDICHYLVKQRQLTNMASFSQDDEYGLDGHLAGKARLKQFGLGYAAEVDYKRADIDLSAQAAKLKESGAEAVILQAVYREPPRLAEQVGRLGLPYTWGVTYARQNIGCG
jgi:ABC-type branched-subunit amino acid transport system substrate-binding protein